MRQWINLFEEGNVPDESLSEDDMRSTEFKSRRAEFGLVEKVEPDYDLKAKYDQFNTKFFGGELPTIPLSFAQLKNVGGHVTCKLTPDIQKLKAAGYSLEQYNRSTARAQAQFQMLLPGSMAMQISSLYKKSEELIDGILLHEMIHVYFLSIGDVIEDHGTKFNNMRRKLSIDSGINVPLRDKIEGLELSIAPKAVCVLIRHTDDGKTAFALVNEKFAMDHLDALKARVPYYAKHELLFRIVGKLWTEKSMQMKVQRSERLSYYYVTDPALLEELTNSGRVIAKLK